MYFTLFPSRNKILLLIYTYFFPLGFDHLISGFLHELSILNIVYEDILVNLRPQVMVFG